MEGTGERGEGTKREERVNDTKSNHSLETFQFLSVGCIFFLMQSNYLEGPASPISGHLIRMQLSPTQHIQTISLDPSILG